MYWDMLKALLKGQFNKMSSSIKTETRSWEQFVVQEVKKAEAMYVDLPSTHTEKIWVEAQRLAKQVFLTKAENKSFFL